jgi:predicted RNA methylase
MDFIWSNTDFPYMCLKDKKRTKAFRRAICCVVKKGDVVIDVGAGSGILSFFAAEAGAEKVYSVEIDHLLAEALRKSIKVNNLQNKISVVEIDILKAKLPKDVDVVISELIDTALIDEMQVPALNKLKKRQIITKKTKVIPGCYKTMLQLVYADNDYYGYYVASPKHEWPFYSCKNTGWVKTRIKVVSELVEIFSADFNSNHQVVEKVEKIVEFKLNKKKANAIKISGLITLAPGIFLGPTNALNGDKIIPIDLIENIDKVRLKISYKMGKSLGSFKFKIL